MQNHVMKKIWKNPILKPTEKLLLLFFVTKIESPGQWLQIKNEEICKSVGYKKWDNAAEHLSALQNKGFLKKRAVFENDGRQSANQYTWTVMALLDEKEDEEDFFSSKRV